MKFHSPLHPPAARRAFAAGAGALFVLSAGLHGAEVFSEGFDSEETAKVEQILGAGMTARFVDYGNLEVGALVHHIPEAPRRIPGSAPTRGVLMRANYEAPYEQRTGNLAALDAPGGNRLELSDNFRLTFDFYLRQSPDVTLNAGGVPVNAGTTEQMLWAVGYTSASPAGRNWRSSRGSGAWGWLSAEGGYGPATGADASLFRGTELVGGRDMNATTTPVPFFTDAFGADASPVPHCPANQWVEAAITVRAGRITVEYRGAGRVATRFFEREPVAPPDGLTGTVMVGYEDSTASASFDPDNQWLLVDNIVVESLPPPTMTVTQTTPLVTWTGAPQTAVFRLANTRSEGTLSVSKATFDGPDAADFSISTPLPLVIPAGGSADLEMVFHPANGPDGVRTASLTIESDDPEEPSYVIPDIRGRRAGGGFLLARYRLDETAGTTLEDASGNILAVPGRLETAGREPVAFGRPGLLGETEGGTSMGFLTAQTSSTGNYVTTPVTHTPSFTISLWIRPEDTGLDRALLPRLHRHAGQNLRAHFVRRQSPALPGRGKHRAHRRRHAARKRGNLPRRRHASGRGRVRQFQRLARPDLHQRRAGGGSLRSGGGEPGL